jgi:sugar/nucleoside kinase (ribokinase family)
MSAEKLKYDPSDLRYRHIIGTGGIGSGKFFVLNGDHTLGREESRSGHFLDINDYCKQHIILHYIKVLLGNDFSVMPVGRIGDDDTGRKLFEEMRSTRFVTDRIEMMPGVSTLFSFCFYYPDGSGGNLTTDNSASSMVDEAFVELALPDIRKAGAAGIIMAAPEVPLGSRKVLLAAGKKYGLFCTASFTSEELTGSVDYNMFANTDLVALNADEASVLAGISYGNDTKHVVETAIMKLQNYNPAIMVSVTDGKRGSWCWNGQELKHFPAIITKAVSTAGAGDAFFSGLLTGLSLNLDLFGSQQLGSLIAGLSVTSPHTINKAINRSSLNEFIKKSGIVFSDKIYKMLEE